MAAHIDVAVRFESDAFFFEKCSLPLPAGSRAANHINDAMAGQQLCSRCIAKRAPHHACVARPTC